MSLKPFKRPSFKSVGQQEDKHATFEYSQPSKRRKLSPELEEGDISVPSLPIQRQPTERLNRKPLEPVLNPPSPTKANDGSESGKLYFSIVFRKVTAKKNKTWEDDGVMVYKNGLITAYSNKGHKIGSTVRDKIPDEEDLFTLSGKDVQVEGRISYNDFCLAVGRDSGVSKTENVVIHHGKSPKKVPVLTPGKAKPPMTLQEQMRQQIQNKSSSKKSTILETQSTAKGMNSAFKQPMKDTQFHPDTPTEEPIPKHNPASPNALVFKRPKKAPSGKQIVDVVLDPILTKHLRSHQRAGVQFLYECVMGLRDFGGQGCILADDMGSTLR